jgi:hypothetical protein
MPVNKVGDIEGQQIYTKQPSQIWRVAWFCYSIQVTLQGLEP